MRGGTHFAHVLMLEALDELRRAAAPAPTQQRLAWATVPKVDGERRRQHSARCGEEEGVRRACFFMVVVRGGAESKGSGARHAAATRDLDNRDACQRTQRAKATASHLWMLVLASIVFVVKPVPGVAARQDGAAHCHE